MSFASMAVPSMFTPKTPSRSKDCSFLPLNSSPLASSPASSPVSAAQARRRSQYKTHATSTPSASRSRQSTRRDTNRNHASSNSRALTATPTTISADENRKTLLRERFRSQCLERAQKDRQRRIDGKRRMSSEYSSDGPDDMMDFDGSEDEDAILNDELFGRIMSSVKRKQQHQYRVSYAQEVGSSFDPDFDDVTEWENELREEPQLAAPEDPEEEELAAYIEEYELGLGDLPYDEIFSLSDLEDIEEERPLQPNSQNDKHRGSEDVEMDS
ncbi:hypothetical protein QCA50_013885 [Cerrena zonata]|uniref:Uncharacterized protein n=1 Tax=Cerrena zonata TaxID=2478898 RepID=A0AAW0FSY2_9APHY